jgi:hypothetical protein
MKKLTRRHFLHAAAAAGTALSALPALAQTTKVTKDTLRPVVEANALAITDAQLEKLAPAVEWSLGEMRKLRDVDVGLGGPAPVFLPAAHAGEKRP